MMTSPLPQLYNWTFRRVIWATLVFVAVGVSFWLLYRFNQIIFILAVAIILGTILRPPVTWLQQRGIPGVVGVILVYLLLLALLIGFIFLLAPLIVEQGTTIAAALPDYYQSLHVWLYEHPNQLTESLRAVLPPTLLFSPLTQQTGAEILASAGQALGYVALTAETLLTTMAILLLAFHWTLDGPRAVQALLLLLPMSQRDSGRELVTAMETKVGAYLIGQGVLCLVIGLMALVAYWLIGLPYVLVLAFVAGIMEAIPFIGPFLGAIPAVLVALTLGPDKLIWVIVATIVIQQVENSILVPRVMRRAVGVNPFVSLLAIFAFSSLLGVAGALMAIPIAAIIQLLLDRFVFQSGALESGVMVGRDYASRLRYEAQDLAQDLRKQSRLTKDGAVQNVGQVDQVMDEIEAITTDLDRLLAQARVEEEP